MFRPLSGRDIKTKTITKGYLLIVLNQLSNYLYWKIYHIIVKDGQKIDGVNQTSLFFVNEHK